MTMRRISALLSLLVCLGAAAAETAPPSPPVSDPDGNSTSPSVNSDTAKPVAEAPAAKTPEAEPKGEKTKDGDFKPSEQISEDMSVAYPVDI